MNKLLVTALVICFGTAAFAADKKEKSNKKRAPAAESGTFLCGTASFEGGKYDPSLQLTLNKDCDQSKPFQILSTNDTKIQDVRFCCIAK